MEPIVVKFKDQLVGPEPGVEDEFKPESGTTFTEISITGEGCAVKVSKAKIIGTQTCKLPGVETLAVVHEVGCTAAGSKLKLGSEAAEFTSTQEIELKSKQKFMAK